MSLTTAPSLSKEELKRQRRELNDANIAKKKAAKEARKKALRAPKPTTKKTRRIQQEDLPSARTLVKIFVCVVSLFITFLVYTSIKCNKLVPVNVFAFGMFFFLYILPNDRCAILRTSRFKYLRQLYKTFSIFLFLFNLSQVPLTPVIDDLDEVPGARTLIGEILSTGPDTYQKKSSNVSQIASLLGLVSELLDGASSVVDIGAGKALYTRAIYEMGKRRIPTIALDNRKGGKDDEFYDPPSSSDSESCCCYTRVVCDVKQVSDETLGLLGEEAVAVTKHLCGGATDSILMSIGSYPLRNCVKRLCVAGCCHQKTKRDEYCNMEFLNKHSLCFTHVGVRGGVQDNDFRTLQMLISISKNNATLFDFEYAKKPLVKLVGFETARNWGRVARRVLEEGRMEFLRERGWNCELRRYVDEAVTGDNLVIVGRRKSKIE
ncbi:hypothetical protein TrVE_jg12570 [Triparma verrucosa]|uniref:tRNA:m(4)X modification enzyme TRM13 n=2 Tax=Triparma TaxID=722752 RepID=A0A9W7AGS0_9STRA|nr:hypothetical protein TrST_g9855 [Triparma strigata]GMI13249.1 hypothetical protein TrVE_jg12570 [Triparma verrucosa]